LDAPLRENSTPISYRYFSQIRSHRCVPDPLLPPELLATFFAADTVGGGFFRSNKTW